MLKESTVSTLKITIMLKESTVSTLKITRVAKLCYGMMIQYLTKIHKGLRRTRI